MSTVVGNSVKLVELLRVEDRSAAIVGEIAASEHVTLGTCQAVRALDRAMRDPCTQLSPHTRINDLRRARVRLCCVIVLLVGTGVAFRGAANRARRGGHRTVGGGRAGTAKARQSDRGVRDWRAPNGESRPVRGRGPTLRTAQTLPCGQSRTWTADRPNCGQTETRCSELMAMRYLSRAARNA